MVFINRRTNLTGATLAVGLTLFSGLAFAAEQRSADDIIMALKPRVTRGLTTSPPTQRAPRTRHILSKHCAIDPPVRSRLRSETRSHRSPARNRK